MITGPAISPGDPYTPAYCRARNELAVWSLGLGWASIGLGDAAILLFVLVPLVLVGNALPVAGTVGGAGR